MDKITILCADTKSNYYKIPALDIWTINENAWGYEGNNKVIAHPPCQQWSKLKAFAKPNWQEKQLALWCWDIVNKNGGILEHPKGSDLFKHVNADRKKLFSVDQHWFGFPAKKTTLLYVHEVELLPYPLNLNAITKTVQSMNQRKRSIMTLEFCQYLVNSIDRKRDVCSRSAS